MSSSISSAASLDRSQSSWSAISAALFCSSVIGAEESVLAFSKPEVLPSSASAALTAWRFLSQSSAPPNPDSSMVFFTPDLTITSSICLKLLTVSSSTSVFERSQSRALSIEVIPGLPFFGMRESIFLKVATDKATETSSSTSSSVLLFRSQSRALAISLARFCSSDMGPANCEAGLVFNSLFS